jgi:RNA polymerase sigma-70 factor (ECF subfamily)
MSDFSDSELIARTLLSGDRNAFGELVRRHQSDVRALLRKLVCGDHALADDLAQETFIRAYRSLGKFQGNSGFGTWLYRIAYNVFVSDSRRSHIRREVEFVDEMHPSTQNLGEDRLQARFDLEKAMACLTVEERAAISLCYGKQMTHDEAAKLLDCPLGTLKTNLLRGKEKLKSRISALERNSVYEPSRS